MLTFEMKPISRVLDELKQDQCRHRELMLALEACSDSSDRERAFERFCAESRSLHNAVRRCLYTRALEAAETRDLATQCINLSARLDDELMQMRQHPASSTAWQEGFDTICRLARYHWENQNDLIAGLEYILDEAEQRDLLNAFRVLKSESYRAYSQI